MTPPIRPFSILAAIAYAVRAGVAHYRFARSSYRVETFPDGIGLVVSSRTPTHDEMNTIGCRWSDWSRMQGAQPTDPAVIWQDMAMMWCALHRERQERKAS